jgi:hypothetical protein
VLLRVLRLMVEGRGVGRMGLSPVRGYCYDRDVYYMYAYCSLLDAIRMMVVNGCCFPSS